MAQCKAGVVVALAAMACVIGGSLPAATAASDRPPYSCPPGSHSGQIYLLSIGGHTPRQDACRPTNTDALSVAVYNCASRMMVYVTGCNVTVVPDVRAPYQDEPPALPCKLLRLTGSLVEDTVAKVNLQANASEWLTHLQRHADLVSSFGFTTPADMLKGLWRALDHVFDDPVFRRRPLPTPSAEPPAAPAVPASAPGVGGHQSQALQQGQGRLRLQRTRRLASLDDALASTAAARRALLAADTVEDTGAIDWVDGSSSGGWEHDGEDYGDDYRGDYAGQRSNSALSSASSSSPALSGKLATGEEDAGSAAGAAAPQQGLLRKGNGKKGKRPDTLTLYRFDDRVMLKTPHGCKHRFEIDGKARVLVPQHEERMRETWRLVYICAAIMGTIVVFVGVFLLLHFSTTYSELILQQAEYKVLQQKLLATEQLKKDQEEEKLRAQEKKKQQQQQQGCNGVDVGAEGAAAPVADKGEITTEEVSAAAGAGGGAVGAGPSAAAADVTSAGEGHGGTTGQQH